MTFLIIRTPTPTPRNQSIHQAIHQSDQNNESKRSECTPINSIDSIGLAAHFGKQPTLSHWGSWINAHKTLDPVCNSGWPATLLINIVMESRYIWRNLSKPSLRCSMTSSENRFVKTLPGSGGIETLDDSRSRMSRKCSKSLYRLRTDETSAWKREY